MALLARLCLLLFLGAISAVSAQGTLSFSFEWDILGPFPRGMREIGADPLECWGMN